MRTLHKSWQDKRPGWTRRVRWYDGPEIRLCFEDQYGKQNKFYTNAADAQHDYDQFKENS